jgi:zinc protease
MRKIKLVYALLLSASLLIVGAAIRPTVATAADGGNPAPDTAAPFRIPIKQVTLKNGLRVILSEDHTAPTYSICVDYNVGSRNERTGRTGFAHLFEHMMFQGSENVGKGEMNILVQNNGGGMNGTTDKDRTVYYETLPANQLDLGFFMESDRMRALAINQANLDNQRNAVQEERRLRVDNQPYGKTFEKVDDLAYENPAYKHSVIGSMEDLNAASVADVTGFFKTYYAPNNAVLVLVGDFKSDEALTKIEKYFGGIPRQPDAPPVDMKEPAQMAERRATLEDALARTPRLDMAYKITPGYTADWYALDVVGDVLTNGQSSRLYQELVKDKSMVTGVFGGAGNDRGPALFRVIANVKPGVSPTDVEKAIEADIERIQKDGITAEELSKTIIRDRVSHIQSLQGTLNRAIGIGEFAVDFNDPEMINKGDAAYAKVTLADVKRVAQKYLTANNRTVVITVPKAAAPAGAGQ